MLSLKQAGLPRNLWLLAGDGGYTKGKNDEGDVLVALLIGYNVC